MREAKKKHAESKPQVGTTVRKKLRLGNRRSLAGMARLATSAREIALTTTKAPANYCF
jgi:hypothetical protein